MERKGTVEKEELRESARSEREEGRAKERKGERGDSTANHPHDQPCSETQPASQPNQPVSYSTLSKCKEEQPCVRPPLSHTLPLST